MRDINKWIKRYTYLMLCSTIFFSVAIATKTLLFILPTLSLMEILLFGWVISFIGLVVPIWMYLMLIDTIPWECKE